MKRQLYYYFARFILLTYLVLISAANVRSQVFDYAFQIGGESQDFGGDIATDASGNSFVTGSFRFTADFDPGPGVFNLTSSGGPATDIFVAKYDPTGNLVWAFNLEGPINVNAEGRAIAVDVNDNDNVYVSGLFRGTVDFDPGPGIFNLSSSPIPGFPQSAGSRDIFLAKYDTAGNFIWAIGFGNPTGKNIHGIILDILGNIYLTGFFRNTVDFDPGPGIFNLTGSAVHVKDIYLAKYDPLGNFVWAFTIGSSNGSDSGLSIGLDGSRNVYLAGHLDGTADFDPGPGVFTLTNLNPGVEDIYLAKYDPLGNFIWAFNLDGTGGEGGTSLTVDAAGNSYVGGYFESTMDFDPGPGIFTLNHTGNRDIYLAKYDTDGSFIWAFSVGSNDLDQVHSIDRDASGNIVIAGRFSGTADFDPGPNTFNLSSNGSEDIFAAKYDNSGNFIWAIGAGSNGRDVLNGVAVDFAGNTFVTGSFFGTVDFDPGPGTFNLTSPSPWSDIFVLKLNPNPCSFDVTAPVADVASLLDATGECSASVTAPTATDNCAGTITATTTDPLNYNTQGTFTINWTYDDGNGNTSTQTQNVVIDDITAPVADIETLADVTAECVVTELTAPTATDNCGGAVIVTNDADLPISGEGTTTVVTWTYDDGNGNTATQTQNVIVESNDAPVIAPLTLPIDPLDISQQINASANFVDVNPESASWDWGDMTSSAGVIAGITITGNHTYTTPGVYEVSLTLTDVCGLQTTEIFQYVVIYDPNGGFVTGGGWINSPAGAYVPDPSLTGKANFGFVSKYKKGQTVPDGNTEFQFKTGDLKFKSVSYDWLTIAGTKAIFKGDGTINGQGDYGFLLSAKDENKNEGDDAFRIKIWDNSDEAVVYDNQLGDEDSGDATTIIEGGSITIHNIKGNNSASRLSATTEPVDDNSELKNVMLKLYPNPAISEINVQLINAVGKSAEINIVDQLGRIILIQKRYKVSNIPMTISTEKLAKGIYFLQVITENSGNTSLSKTFIISD